MDKWNTKSYAHFSWYTVVLMHVYIPSVEVGMGKGNDPFCARKINKTFLSDTVLVGFIERLV